MTAPDNLGNAHYAAIQKLQSRPYPWLVMGAMDGFLAAAGQHVAEAGGTEKISPEDLGAIGKLGSAIVQTALEVAQNPKTKPPFLPGQIGTLELLQKMYAGLVPQPEQP